MLTNEATADRWMPRFNSVPCHGPHGPHRMAYVEWGDPANARVLLCVHGLTRNGRDFDFLARALADGWRVVCPDVAGRGQSDRLAHADDYALPTYAADMLALIAQLGVAQVDWVGTSMGGLIGMLLAGQPGSPIRRMVLNDVGPVIAADALRRIGDYVGKAPRFADRAEAERYVRLVCAPFGRLEEAQWQHLVEYGTRRCDDGACEMAYDPAIGEPFRRLALSGDIDLWPVYESIRCPVLVLRGMESDVLTQATLAEMASRGPRAQTAEFTHVGHAPALMAQNQIAVVRGFLAGAGG